MKKYTILWALVLLPALTGCGQNEREEILPSGEYVPTAEFMELPVTDGNKFSGKQQFLYRDGEIYYLDVTRVPKEQHEDDGHMESRLWTVPLAGDGTPRLLEEGIQKGEGTSAYCFTVDGEKNLYFYERQTSRGTDGEPQYTYYLRKVDAEGADVYRSVLPDPAYSAQGIYVDREGNAALFLPAYDTNSLYFYDSAGRYRGAAALPWEAGFSSTHHCTNNIVCAGEDGYFLWEVDFFENSLRLWEVDFQEMGIQEDPIVIDMPPLAGGVQRTGSADYTLLGDEQAGLLISVRDMLWRYDLETGEAEVLLRWDDENIDIDGRYVAQASFGAPGGGGIPLNVLFYDSYTSSDGYYDLMSADITYTDRAYLPRRQTVRIGLGESFGSSGEIGCLLRRFNRYSSTYRAEAAQYSPEDLQELLMHGEDVPDLLDITGLRIQWLESKGLLEDLTPRFERSTEAGKEDILPSVWALSVRDGKVTHMPCGFRVSSLSTAADVPEGGWDYSQYLEMGDRYPGSWYFSRFDGGQVWSVIAQTSLDSFIDWDRRECRFDSREFLDLLEKTAGLSYPPHRKNRGGSEEQLREDLLSAQILFRSSSYGSPYDMDRARTDSGDRLKEAGYPTADKEPAFIFSPTQDLAVYALSPVKDGAWAFLEFLLSGGRQDWYSTQNDAFPVRRDAFEEYLYKSYSSKTSLVIDGIEHFEDTPEKLLFMTEHMVRGQNAQDEAAKILLEEIQACCAGDKTPEETAQVIQSRVQLYLDEM